MDELVLGCSGPVCDTSGIGDALFEAVSAEGAEDHGAGTVNRGKGE